MTKKLTAVAALIALAACTAPGATPPPGLPLPVDPPLPFGACAPPAVRSIVYVDASQFGALSESTPVLDGLSVLAESSPELSEPWVVACLDDQQAQALQDRVAVEPDPVMTASEDMTKLWGLPKISAPAAWLKTEGAGIVVAVIDTGTDCAHEDIGGCSWSVDLAGGPPYNPHGTHVSGTIAARSNGAGVVGVAPKASIGSCQALDKNGSGFTSNIASCITESTNRGADVINMSLGGPSASSALDSAVANAIARGVVVVAAAGNSNTSTPSYPGCSTGVIGVGATDRNDQRASFSNHGTCVDIAAPGVDILSTTPGGAYNTFSGTSMASPHVAGVVALVLAIGHAPSAALTVLRDTADTGPSNLGGKRVNAARAVGGEPLPFTPAPPIASPTPVAATPGPWPVTPVPPAPSPCVYSAVVIEAGQPVLRRVYGPCAPGSTP